MLNIGPQELLVILIIALVVVGPQRLPELGRTIGKGLREFRKVQDEVRDMVNLGVDDDLKETAAELKRTASDIKRASDPRQLLKHFDPDDAPPKAGSGRPSAEDGRNGGIASHASPDHLAGLTDEVSSAGETPGSEDGTPQAPDEGDLPEPSGDG
jgi:Tat protein translocase TatB subunit